MQACKTHWPVNVFVLIYIHFKFIGKIRGQYSLSTYLCSYYFNQFVFFIISDAERLVSYE